MTTPAKESDIFLGNLPRNRRVTVEQMWEAIRLTFPNQGISENWRSKLKSLLDQLAAAGIVSLPIGRQCYDSGRPPLPKWITRSDVQKSGTEKLDRHLWAPELAFLAEFPLEIDTEWLKVDEWLKAGGRQAEFVPQKERSLEVFDDEKRLDVFLRKAPFRSGLITRDTLRCFYVPEPICCTAGPSGSKEKLGLVVENATTFSSLCEFNERAGRYGFIAYGGGNSFLSTVEGLMVHLELYGHCKVLYFGDIDWDGVQIMLGARKKLVQRGFELEADEWLYRLLLEQGRGRVFKAVRHGEIPSETKDVMSVELAGEVQAVIASGLRLPQELVGKTVLTGLLAPQYI